MLLFLNSFIFIILCPLSRREESSKNNAKDGVIFSETWPKVIAGGETESDVNFGFYFATTRGRNGTG